MMEEAPRFITPEQYLKAEEAAEFRSEYFNGIIVAREAGSRCHNQIQRNISLRLLALLDSPNKLFLSHTRLHIPNQNSFFYPDAMLLGGEPTYAKTETETLLNPAVIIEVFSPTTEAADRGRKFVCYRTLPSLVHYVLLSQFAPAFDLYTRLENGRWRLQSLSGMEAVLRLDTIPLALPLSQIYEEMEALMAEEARAEEMRQAEERLEAHLLQGFNSLGHTWTQDDVEYIKRAVRDRLTLKKEEG